VWFHFYFFIGLEQGKVIVKRYDRKTLYPMLLKCHHHLHPLSKNVIMDQGVDEYFSFDIFEVTSNTNELAKNLSTRKF
jgi:hypothetical protein